MTADGEGLLVDMSNLNRVRTVQLSSFTFDKFRQMCMLSGCDYLQSVKGMGLKKAHNAHKKHADAYKVIKSNFVFFYMFLLCLVILFTNEMNVFSKKKEF